VHRNIIILHYHTPDHLAFKYDENQMIQWRWTARWHIPVGLYDRLCLGSWAPCSRWRHACRVTKSSPWWDCDKISVVLPAIPVHIQQRGETEAIQRIPVPIHTQQAIPPIYKNKEYQSINLSRPTYIAPCRSLSHS